MNPVTVLVIFAGLFLAWVIQIVLSLRQAGAFNASVRLLRTKGLTAVGRGGSRYRGVVYVVLAVGPDGLVVAAEVLRGFSVFARPHPAGGFVGRSAADLADIDPKSSLDQAVSHAAVSILDHGNSEEARSSQALKCRYRY